MSNSSDMVEGLHMVGGEGETSYAANSLLQRKAMLKVKPEMKQAIIGMVSNNKSSKMVVADLGCSSGPNTLLAVYEILNIITECFPSCKTRPDVQFFLNDLPGNDFNNIFRLLVPFRRKLMSGKKSDPLFVCGVPGSFYERIFPDESVHFIYSSYSLHFLSKVPVKIQRKNSARLDNNYIYLSKSTPPSVAKSYKEQYNMDFTLFLKLRAKELIIGGYMVLLFLGRSDLDPMCSECSYLWGVLADVLNDMVMEGLLEETSLSKFKLPFYSPSLEEVKEIVKDEPSFDIDVASSFEMSWDPYYDDSKDSLRTTDEDNTCGENIAKYLRAVIEPLLRAHFFEIDMGDVFSRYARKVVAVPNKDRKYINILLVLKRVYY